ncbi:YqiJ family protein [Alteromonas pelagimontana]|uniref:YqiJ family protein n=1 Tax=Alteromonas pelagimontana TaxID=1858656 RepID=A0A6M4MGP9_9ALTE|nr:YqiJ family protein [Alteromonas pelagimontana]QJR82253.1 YqiJ family protein [Alteromonas pelagimontana]
MFSFLLSDANFWFSVAIGVVVVLFVVECIGLLFGASLLGVFDDIPGYELTSDTDIDVGHPTAFANWLSLDKLPLMIWVIIFLTLFGLTGYLLNYLYEQFFQSLIPALLSLPVASVSALILTGGIGKRIAPLLPKNETSAISDDEYFGAIAKITIGTARPGSPAEAKFVDKYAQAHYVLVEPFEAQEVFSQGEKIILVKKGLRGWLATRYK